MTISRSLLATAAMVLALGFVGPSFADDAKPYAGRTVTVVLPPWGTLPKEMTDHFTAKTGINVDMQTLGWEQIRSKVVTSMLAGSAPGDVVEVDWSWANQFGQTGWFLPLNDLVSDEDKQDMPPTRIFEADGSIIGLPWNNDFRILIFNKDHLAKAGIKDEPKTLDEVTAAAKAIKAKGIANYPIVLPLSATEGTSTTWYLLTKAFGGDVLDADSKPAFGDKDSAGYKAMAWLISAVKDGLIDPGATGLTDVQVQELFKSGAGSIDLNGWVANLEVYNDASKTKVAGQVDSTTFPSEDGKVRIYGLPEGVGIPKTSPNQEPAAEFIKWLMTADAQMQMRKALGNLPTRTSVLKTLSEKGEVAVNPTVLSQVAEVQPFFSTGAPAWYPEFSTAVSSAINQAAKGQISVDDAIKQMVDKTNEIIAQQ